MLVLRAGLSGLVVFVTRIHCVAASLSWSEMDLRYSDPHVAERDISHNSPIDQLSLFGILLNSVIFDLQGYTNASLSTVHKFLNLKYGIFMLDLYWNHFTQTWQLCPAPIPAKDTLELSKTVQVSWKNKTYTCLPEFTVNDLFKTVDSYLSGTNVRLEANVVQFALNLKSIYIHELRSGLRSNSSSSRNSTGTIPKKTDRIPREYMSYNGAYLRLGNATLWGALSAVDSYLFTPQVLELWHKSSAHASKYPTQGTYLFNLHRRVLPFVVSNVLHNSTSGYHISPDDEQTVFFANKKGFLPWVESHGSDTLVQNITDASHSSDSSIFKKLFSDSHFRIVIDDENNRFTTASVSEYLKSGYSTILNSSHPRTASDPEQGALDIASAYTPASFWSWAANQFNKSQNWSDTDDRRTKYVTTDGWYEAVNLHTAYLCVSATSSGWMPQNCYDRIRGVCQNDTDPFSWELTPHILSYLEWGSDLSCPIGHSVGVPRLSLEQSSLISYLQNKDVNFPVWIDLNDITILGCYVLGGPYALCPYQETLTTRNLVKNLAPSSVIALFLIILIFCERIFIKTPIHTNRKRHWKRKITDYYKENDYEGVPL